MSRRASPITSSFSKPESDAAPAAPPPPVKQPPRLFVSRAIPQPALDLLNNAMPTLRIDINTDERNLFGEELVQRAKGSTALISTLADNIDREVLQALSPALKVVATYAVGTNNIDLKAARELGIRVTNTPGVLTEATAEVAVALILACARRVVEGDRATRAGKFTGWAPLYMRGRTVFGSTVGIIGAGRIGGTVARTMRAGFGCRILYHTTTPHPELDTELHARQVSLDELLELSDFVSIHCPLTDETRHLIGNNALSRMKPTAFLINTARGPIVDEPALVQMLRKNRIAGAGFDVYEHEPNLSPGLADLDNVVLLPHIGSATVETRDRMGLICAQSVLDVLAGKEPQNRVV
ncbi:MAG: D-glycerate dehydrogenase [Planctomycetes bacterium]|nr:D-glycerate dehydrogenase [Planctomycetota bacterium]